MRITRIKSVSFDRHPSTAIHPRAALFLLRSVEIFRQLGLMEVMRNESALNFDLDAGMIIVEQLVGGKTIMSLQESDPVEVAKVSPCVRLWLTQNMFEPLLRREAKNFGAKQEFSEAVVWYEAVDDGVIVVVQNLKTMGYRKFKAQYLVACDGNRSATREKEGIEWHGPGILGDCISINFKADLAPYLGTRAVHGVTYITNPRIDAGFRLESGGQGGFMIVARAGARNGFLPDSVTEREARQYFYDASGIDHEIELEIESISYWNAAALVADRFDSEDGRVFIAGDAAHLLPPTGGMGGNTGVQVRASTAPFTMRLLTYFRMCTTWPGNSPLPSLGRLLLHFYKAIARNDDQLPNSQCNKHTSDFRSVYSNRSSRRTSSRTSCAKLGTDISPVHSLPTLKQSQQKRSGRIHMSHSLRQAVDCRTSISLMNDARRECFRPWI